MTLKALKTFMSPGSAYRGKPFWAWNGDLEPAELRRQVRVMHEMGLGGFFMHSRFGLVTEYLSYKWFECVNTCIDEAGRLGMEAWLYDEDRWPSGAAGGIVTKNPSYCMRSVEMQLISDPARLRRDKDTIAVFVGKVDGQAGTELRRVTGRANPAPAHGETILHFRRELMIPEDWYNGQRYLDTMNHEAVKEFLTVTHEQYRKKCGRHFGTVVPGIFTDEPNYSLWGHGDRTELAWTESLPAVFRKRYGYDLLDHLPELFLQVDGRDISRPRYHYYDCITHLFVDAFARQIGDWCERNGLLHTGHVLAEDSLFDQVKTVGSAMRFYEYMQAPGMDLLTERWRCYDTAKQVSSVARQFNRKWRLTETYGCTGWDFSFAGHKALGDWQVALGINLRCHHLASYTLQGEAKRDYPAAISYQSNWWNHYRAVEDYFARIQAVMTRGTEIRDLLIVHSVESIWSVYHNSPADDPLIRQCEAAIGIPRDTFLAANIDFDYGDEDIIARHSRATRSKDGPRFHVGRASYKAVLVPPLKTIRSSTLEVLEKFSKLGGRVVFANPVPQFVDVVRSDAARKLARSCSTVPHSPGRMVAALEEDTRRLSITDASGKDIKPALHLLREDREAYYLFVCNTGYSVNRVGEPARLGDEIRAEARSAEFPDVHLTFMPPATGRPLELDPKTGRCFEAKARRTKAGWTVRTSLPVLGSRLFVFPKRAAGRLPTIRELKTRRSASLTRARWQIQLSEPNNLVLDKPRWRLNPGEWQPAEEVLRVDAAIRRTARLPVRDVGMVQPWAMKKTLKRPLDVDLHYSFDCRCLPSSPVHLALEDPGRFSISVNDKPISVDSDCGWWTDMSLRRLPIDPAILRKGSNDIRLKCRYDEDFSGLEIMYLLGDFGVRVTGSKVTMTDTPAPLKTGNWTGQGLPFYSGSVTYKCTIRPTIRGKQRLFVVVPEYKGVAVRILVDGEPAGLIFSEPNEVDITDYITGNRTDLGIEIIGHRRNSHGPLHHAEKWPILTGPGEFASSGNLWKDDYQLVPCGLMKPPRLSWRGV